MLAQACACVGVWAASRSFDVWLGAGLLTPCSAVRLVRRTVNRQVSWTMAIGPSLSCVCGCCALSHVRFYSPAQSEGPLHHVINRKSCAPGRNTGLRGRALSWIRLRRWDVRLALITHFCAPSCGHERVRCLLDRSRPCRSAIHDPPMLSLIRPLPASESPKLDHGAARPSCPPQFGDDDGYVLSISLASNLSCCWHVGRQAEQNPLSACHCSCCLVVLGFSLQHSDAGPRV